ncbi:DUF3169 family protein [Bacillus sp. DX1.1]|uniref:DUF3169 family protein n=1 Tax=unclassified Bacillus (in: firmicutes) TaxID=185979 RepID=UPI0025708F1C|nr:MULTISPECIES: DUF3169 family protein [unclassified Bacillus (in: firmicutes)]MDM5157150.1 DUF3169 family protein [Bacillus sp. DX1.1]WJE84178.1 DUF3169 family protein [Bacillus sp. DX3.1]
MESRVQYTIRSMIKILVGMVFGFLGGYILSAVFAAGPRKLPSYMGVIGFIVFGVGIIYYLWKNTRILAKLRDEEESVQGRRLGILLMYLRASEVIVWSWAICAGIAYYRSFLAGTTSLFEIGNAGVSVVCLILVIWIGFIMKNRYNTLYPEQSVTYSQSLEMWAKNADEGQKHIIHEAGYKAYQFTNMVLAWVWIAAIAYTILDKTDFFLIGIISFVWVLHIGKYMYEMHKKMIY